MEMDVRTCTYMYVGRVTKNSQPSASELLPVMVGGRVWPNLSNVYSLGSCWF